MSQSRQIVSSCIGNAKMPLTHKYTIKIQNHHKLTYWNSVRIFPSNFFAFFFATFKWMLLFILPLHLYTSNQSTASKFYLFSRKNNYAAKHIECSSVAKHIPIDAGGLGLIPGLPESNTVSLTIPNHCNVSLDLCYPGAQPQRTLPIVTGFGIMPRI